MAFSLQLDLKEVNQWLSNQPQRDVARRRMITKIKNKTVEKAKDAIKGHSTTGRLENSISSTVTGSGFTVYSLLYGDIVLEYGRSSGARPPEEPLREWIKLKFGATDSEAWIGARHLANKIADKGTQKFQMGGPKELSEIEEYLDKEFLPSELIKLLEDYTK